MAHSFWNPRVYKTKRWQNCVTVTFICTDYFLCHVVEINVCYGLVAQFHASKRRWQWWYWLGTCEDAVGWLLCYFAIPWSCSPRMAIFTAIIWPLLCLVGRVLSLEAIDVSEQLHLTYWLSSSHLCKAGFLGFHCQKKNSHFYLHCFWWVDIFLSAAHLAF